MQRDAKQVLTELLVLKAQGGEEEAFSELYELWKLDLFRLIRFAVRDGQAAEEIAQETWISIAKALRGVEDPSAFRAWALRIARRRSVDWIRKQESERWVRRKLEAERPSAADPPTADSAESAALSEAIQKLDTDSRLLIHLFYETGLTVEEVGLALELPAGTVKSRLFALREKLKREIERTLK
ncbi:sigma-70 family RNA polymerase sigma factor [Pelagicoccus sp. NFK12]|uniref:Sigma-70 family RNA polymerase sigma factor n=1 Tax=Pelagicoccus enzymogenes TaxID=2773457 RepID=A0A927FA56_9BACT|nr:sigma-70 family RNA polymerase sigma factor [Pelagicoccus enzymogenes]MBD5781313.1 sigma-70 family RNA polymerase sigma factor [Pelagicoccus enzymogenes]